MSLVARSAFYNLMTRGRSRAIARQLAPFLQSEQQVLDFGCGNGFTALYLMDMTGCQITGLDVIRDINLKKDVAEKINFTLFDGNRIPFENESFDAVVASAVMHHTPYPGFFMDEFLRILKPEGIILLVEEMYHTLAGKLLLQAHDYLLNKLKKDVPLPLNFFSIRKYKKIFAERHLLVIHHGSVRPVFPYVRHEVFILKKTP